MSSPALTWRPDRETNTSFLDRARAHRDSPDGASAACALIHAHAQYFVRSKPAATGGAAKFVLACMRLHPGSDAVLVPAARALAALSLSFDDFVWQRARKGPDHQPKKMKDPLRPRHPHPPPPVVPRAIDPATLTWIPDAIDVLTEAIVRSPCASVTTALEQLRIVAMRDPAATAIVVGVGEA